MSSAKVKVWSWKEGLEKKWGSVEEPGTLVERGGVLVGGMLAGSVEEENCIAAAQNIMGLRVWQTDDNQRQLSVGMD